MNKGHFYCYNAFICFILSLLLLISCGPKEDAVKYKDANLPVGERVEDLLSRLAVAFIKGVQGKKVLASVKHFACNNQEWERFKLDVTLSQRALEAAKQSIVLLKNERNVLPLDKNRIKSLAVLGPNAAEARTGGGGSSMVGPFYSVSPLEGLKKSIGNDIEIKYAPGAVIRGDIIPLGSRYMVPANAPVGKTGLWAEYFPNTKLQGKPVLTRVDKVINFNWGYDVPHPELHRANHRNEFSIRWTGKLLPPKTGEYRLDVIHNDGLRLYVDDRLLIDNWRKRPYRLS